jgi:hypothetical protein
MDVWLVPSPNAPYFEWTDFKVTNWRTDMKDELLSGSIKRTNKKIKGVVKVASIVSKGFDYTPIIFDHAVPPKSPLDIVLEISKASLDIIDAAASKIDQIKNDLQDGYRAFLRVKEYRRRGKWHTLVPFVGEWASDWPEGSDKGWCEVKGGAGWHDLGMIQAYETKEAALNALRKAVDLMQPRPDL